MVTKNYKANTKETKYSLEFYVSLLFHHIYYNSEWHNEVEVYYTDRHKFKRSFIRYRNYKSTGFTLPNFTFRSLLETMKPNRVLELVKYLLLEKKVLLVQKHCSDNAVIIESLISLLSPLYSIFLSNSKWNFVNVSYLSDEMTDYIEAPMPFIMGVPRHVWKNMKRQREGMPSDIIIFDIDKNKMTCNEKLPDFPPKAAEAVYSTMLTIVDDREYMRKAYKNSNNYKQYVFLY